MDLMEVKERQRMGREALCVEREGPELVAVGVEFEQQRFVV